MTKPTAPALSETQKRNGRAQIVTTHALTITAHPDGDPADGKPTTVCEGRKHRLHADLPEAAPPGGDYTWSLDPASNTPELADSELDNDERGNATFVVRPTPTHGGDTVRLGESHWRVRCRYVAPGFQAEGEITLVVHAVAFEVAGFEPTVSAQVGSTHNGKLYVRPASGSKVFQCSSEVFVDLVGCPRAADHAHTYLIGYTQTFIGSASDRSWEYQLPAADGTPSTSRYRVWMEPTRDLFRDSAEQTLPLFLNQQPDGTAGAPFYLVDSGGGAGKPVRAPQDPSAAADPFTEDSPGVYPPDPADPRSTDDGLVLQYAQVGWPLVKVTWRDAFVTRLVAWSEGRPQAPIYLAELAWETRFESDVQAGALTQPSAVPTLTNPAPPNSPPHVDDPAIPKDAGMVVQREGATNVSFASVRLDPPDILVIEGSGFLPTSFGTRVWVDDIEVSTSDIDVPSTEEIRIRPAPFTAGGATLRIQVGDTPPAEKRARL